MTTELKLPAGTITRVVKRINRTRTPHEAITATGRMQYLNDKVVIEMPMGEGEEKEIFLIPFKEILTPDKLEQKVDEIGVELADPNTVCALNERYPTLSNTHPNATQWRDKNGRVCYALFPPKNKEPWIRVSVNEERNAFGKIWYFVCFPKENIQVSES